jgi:hypothetical protein
MPERIIQRARNFPPNLYFNAPFETRKKLQIRRGDKLVCIIKRALTREGNLIKNIEKEVTCEVRKRDGRFYIPPKLIQELNLTGREYYEILLLKLIKPNGSGNEIYPNEMIEREIAVKPKT